ARTSPVADQEDSEEAEDTEPFDIEVEAPAPEPEPEEADKPDEDGAAAAATDGYVQPVDGPITSGYGYRTHPVLGSSKLHEGVDFGASCGTPVQAVKSGTVVATEFTSASGNRVKVDHGDGVVTGYYHLQDFATSVGATVEAGEVIGNVGNTGRSTGCHLHFAKMDGAGNYSDPMSILRWAPLPSSSASSPPATRPVSGWSATAACWGRDWPRAPRSPPSSGESSPRSRLGPTSNPPSPPCASPSTMPVSRWVTSPTWPPPPAPAWPPRCMSAWPPPNPWPGPSACPCTASTTWRATPPPTSSSTARCPRTASC